MGVANSMLKLNQIGTLSETLDAIRASGAEYTSVVSHVQVKLNTTIADLVAVNAGRLKQARLRVNELAKCNQLPESRKSLGVRQNIRD